MKSEMSSDSNGGGYCRMKILKRVAIALAFFMSTPLFSGDAITAVDACNVESHQFGSGEELIYLRGEVVPSRHGIYVRCHNTARISNVICVRTTSENVEPKVNYRSDSVALTAIVQAERLILDGKGDDRKNEVTLSGKLFRWASDLGGYCHMGQSKYLLIVKDVIEYKTEKILR